VYCVNSKETLWEGRSTTHSSWPWRRRRSRTYGRTPEALAVIEEAADQGITYFDSARAYVGSEGYYGSFWAKHFDLRDKIFQTSKSASRDKEGARADLAHSLATMGLNYLDLWQIHDIRNGEDIDSIEGPGGALEAFIEAKERVCQD
jgi:aryl-alcohol dehydrogenase-like predicted oxidoreductase